MLHKLQMADDVDEEVQSGTRLRQRPTKREHAAATPFFARTPVLAGGDCVLRSWSLSPRAWLLLSFINGRSSVDMVLAATGMRTENALAILEDLLAKGIVALR
jgi:hypothetical protein